MLVTLPCQAAITKTQLHYLQDKVYVLQHCMKGHTQTDNMLTSLTLPQAVLDYSESSSQPLLSKEMDILLMVFSPSLHMMVLSTLPLAANRSPTTPTMCFLNQSHVSCLLPNLFSLLDYTQENSNTYSLVFIVLGDGMKQACREHSNYFSTFYCHFCS